jgi:nitric oxide reductase NorE protein
MTTTISLDRGDGGWGPLSDLPGHPMMWILIFSEMTAFGLMLVAFAVARLLNHVAFAAGQSHLDPLLGGVNTLVLVTSGWFAARAVLASRRPQRRLLLLGALSLGVVFVAIKLVEYANAIEAGSGLDSDPFSTLYFLLTGFHLLHVVLGVVILAIVAWHARRDAVKIGASFWHMIDLIWLVMYPIIYIVR